MLAKHRNRGYLGVRSFPYQLLVDQPAVLLSGRTHGVADDLSGNGRNGVLAASGYVENRALTPSMNGLDCDGTTGAALIADAAGLSNPAAYSIELWFVMDSFDDTHGNVIAGKRDTSPVGEWDLLVVPSSHVPRFRVFQNVFAIYASTDGNAITTGTLQQIVGTWDGAVVAIYQNGLLVSSSSSTSGTQHGDTSSGIAVGRRSYNTADDPGLDGPWAWFGWYPTALSAGRVAEHYKTGIRSGLAA